MVTVPFSMRLDEDIKLRLEKQARLEKRSASFVVHEALQDFLDGRDYERKIAEQAFAESEKGVFISGEKVHAWVESLGTGDELPFPQPDIFPETSPALKKTG